MRASQLAELGTALVVVGLLATALPRGRHGLPLALFALANLVAGVGNLTGGDRWAGAGNLAAACYLAGLWWHGHRERVAGDPAWLREAMAADAAARERRWAELGRGPDGRPAHEYRPAYEDRPDREGDVA